MVFCERVRHIRSMVLDGRSCRLVASSPSSTRRKLRFVLTTSKMHPCFAVLGALDGLDALGSSVVRWDHCHHHSNGDIVCDFYFLQEGASGSIQGGSVRPQFSTRQVQTLEFAGSWETLPAPAQGRSADLCFPVHDDELVAASCARPTWPSSMPLSLSVQAWSSAYTPFARRQEVLQLHASCKERFDVIEQAIRHFASTTGFGADVTYDSLSVLIVDQMVNEWRSPEQDLDSELRPFFLRHVERHATALAALCLTSRRS
eukprot:TRINITY_DN27082_c0_g2_i2.p1 TRINITY_DN27082_c0_g2~~TRINITY_DN27082_c0_g2_i2.p1  ORF type:complete len:259 (+),score=15.88 TRINITY_DN27082_c0_g2_i2:156-932(+)